MKHVLHCAQVAINLLSINRFCIDNDCYFVLTRSGFLVKDNLTGCTLLTSRSKEGLYPIQIDRESINIFCPSVALMGFRTTLDSHITKIFMKTFDLPISSSSNFNYICQFFQMGKAKQLPFSDSSRVTLSPLGLIHSDV